MVDPDHDENAAVAQSQSENQQATPIVMGYKPRPATPTSLDCRRCREAVKPIKDVYPSWKTHLLAGILFLTGLPFCAFIPYCFDCFGTDVYRCPKCGCYLFEDLKEENNMDIPRRTNC